MINLGTTEFELTDAQLEIVTGGTGGYGGYGAGIIANNYQYTNQQGSNYSAVGNGSLNLWSNANTYQQNNQSSSEVAIWKY